MAYMTGIDYGAGHDETVWVVWSSTSANSGTCASTDTAWTSWTYPDSTSTGTTYSSTSNNVWITWATEPRYVSFRSYEVPRLNTEDYRRQQAELRRQEEERQRAYREEQQRVEEEARQKREALKIAEVKANELLQDLIGEEQLKIYLETGRLLVKGSNFDYMLQRDGKVTRIEQDKMIDLCIHLRDQWQVPPTDNVIALKLLAEADDYKFNQLANVVKERTRPFELPRAACN
jgi:hypothetical protein